MLQPCAAASPAVGNREIVRTDASSDGPDGVSTPGEGLISGALPLMKAEVRPAAFRIAVAIRSGIMLLRAHELKCVGRFDDTWFPFVLDAAP
ncbi:hypothetical protein ESCO110355_26875 [Escherichia coli]